ncbi:unnamed protein product [Trichobilharzia regenti]|nr:unnamed protein product [Trichobilharzia regenti]
MEVDSEDLSKASPAEDAQKVKEKDKNDRNSNMVTDFDDDLEAGDLEDDEDDDGFGVDDDTGVCISNLLPSSNLKACHSDNQSYTPSGMDVDSELSSAESKPKSTKDILNATSSNSEVEDHDEMRCLLRHVQFGRSLVNLVKQVRAKTGGLSLETERLLQQSVSLLAYPSPTSNDCPLRGLLDPVWRDTIASIINSAVLKAHDLPAQPALEHALRALQRCFQDKNFVEAQTLGHFLLYHLTPAQIAKADEEVAAMEASAQHQTGKRLRSSASQSNENQSHEVDGNTSSGSRTTEANGHKGIRRRAQQNDGDTSEGRGSNGGNSGRVHSSNSPNTASLTLLEAIRSSPTSFCQSNRAVFTRYISPLPADSIGAPRVTNVSTASIPNLHRSTGPSHRLTSSTTSARNDNNQPCRPDTDDSHLDSAFRGILSMSYPQHAEFLAAMDDALKAYAGSLLLTDDEQAFTSNPQNQHPRGDPPSPAGDGACA